MERSGFFGLTVNGKIHGHMKEGKIFMNMCELQPSIIVNNRVDVGREGMGHKAGFAGDFGTPEQEIPATEFRRGLGKLHDDE
jgi:hypothetical protein